MNQRLAVLSALEALGFGDTPQHLIPAKVLAAVTAGPAEAVRQFLSAQPVRKPSGRKPTARALDQRRRREQRRREYLAEKQEAS